MSKSNKKDTHVSLEIKPSTNGTTESNAAKMIKKWRRKMKWKKNMKKEREERRKRRERKNIIEKWGERKKRKTKNEAK